MIVLRAVTGNAAWAWREERSLGLLKEMRRLTLDQVHQRVGVLVFAQSLARAAEISPPAGVRIEVFEGGDWSLLADVASPRSLSRFRRCAARGGRTCLVAWRGDRPVGYTWLSEHVDIDLEEYPLPLPAGAVYGWDLYVAGSERCAGVGSALVSARDVGARARGFQTVWTAVYPHNRASLRTLEKAGEFRLVGEAFTVKRLGGGRAKYRPCA